MFRSQRTLAFLLVLALLAGCQPARPADRLAAETANSDMALPPGMDEQQKAFLWEIEHHGLILSKHGFARLVDALRRADPAALSALLASDFQGETLDQPQEVRAANDVVQLVRRTDSGHAAKLLGREAFCQLLLGHRQRFAGAPWAQFSLMALAPDDRANLAGPWQGTGQLRLWGEAAEGGPAEVVLYLRYRVARPTEEALGRPGWLQACAITQSQEARSPHLLFREVAAERGIDRRRFHDNWEHGMKGTSTGGVYLCDYDRDGRLDLLVVDVKCVALYRGLADGKFADVTLEVGLPWRLQDPPGPNLAAAFIDLDGDGWDDLILDRRVYHNEGGRRFTDVTARSNLRLQGDISGYAIADYDGDGRLDLYVARSGPAKASSWIDGKCGGRAGNVLYRNLGNWQFADVTAASGTSGNDRSTFTALWFDANNDGRPDLYVINEFGNGVLLLNQGDGTFREQAITDGPADFGSMGATVGDVDNDGHMDLYIANMYSKAGNRVIGNLRPGTFSTDLTTTLRSYVAGSQLWRNVGGGAGGSPAFVPRGKEWQVAAVGWAYGPALVDLDNDGWLDLYATAGFVSQNRSEPDG
jgi:hypothetical protein